MNQQSPKGKEQEWLDGFFKRVVESASMYWSPKIEAGYKAELLTHFTSNEKVRAATNLQLELGREYSLDYLEGASEQVLRIKGDIGLDEPTRKDGV